MQTTHDHPLAYFWRFLLLVEAEARLTVLCQTALSEAEFATSVDSINCIVQAYSSYHLPVKGTGHVVAQCRCEASQTGWEAYYLAVADLDSTRRELAAMTAEVQRLRGEIEDMESQDEYRRKAHVSAVQRAEAAEAEMAKVREANLWLDRPWRDEANELRLKLTEATDEIEHVSNALSFERNRRLRADAEVERLRTEVEALSK